MRRHPGTPGRRHRTRDVLRRAESEIYFEVTGSGPALVFAHGLGGSYLSWWQQVPYFCDRYTCVTFSHRGFPPSVNICGTVGPEAFADDLAALLDHLGLAEVYLVAQSMGGWTCLTYALRAPERVRGLVLSSSTGTIDFAAIDHPAIAELPSWTERSLAERRRLNAIGVLPSTGSRMAHEQPETSFLYGELYDLTPASYKDSVRRSTRSSRTLPPHQVREIRTPVLLIVGQEDLIFPPMAAAAVASLIPAARVHEVPEAGHSVYFERPEIYNRAVDAFLAEHSGVPTLEAAGSRNARG